MLNSVHLIVLKSLFFLKKSQIPQNQTVKSHLVEPLAVVGLARNARHNCLEGQIVVGVPRPRPTPPPQTHRGTTKKIFFTLKFTILKPVSNFLLTDLESIAAITLHEDG